MYDVIIIGAGLSGLAAAQTCKAAGLKSIILEASDRAGGRVWTTSAPSTQLLVDWGAEWVIPSMHHEVMKLVQENKLDLREDDTSTPTRWQTPHASFIGSYVDLKRTNAGFAASLRRIEQDAILWLNKETIATSPECPARTYLQSIASTPETADLLEAALFPLTGAAPENLATQMLWAEIGFHNQSIDDTLYAPAQRIAQGCDALAKAILEKLNNSVTFNQIVTRIGQRQNSITVETQNATYEAKHCIVALPLMTLQNIKFDPPLQGDLQNIAQHSNAGRVAKAWALVRSKQSLGETMNSHSSLRYGYARKQDAEHTVVCGQFLSDGKDPVTADAATALIEANWPDVVVIDTAVVDWCHEPFARASWHGGRAGWAGKTKLFYAPVGNLHFAGGDIAETWAGWMEGALLSGKAIAKRVVAASMS